jgi:hypothetical protein
MRFELVTVWRILSLLQQQTGPIQLQKYFRGNKGREWQCDGCRENREIECGILQKNDEKLIVTLEDVKIVPELRIDLFSIGTA